MRYSEWVQKHNEEIECAEVREFVADCCALQGGATVNREDLYDTYMRYVRCDSSKVEIPHRRFKKRMLKAFPELAETATLYKGIRIKNYVLPIFRGKEVKRG